MKILFIYYVKSESLPFYFNFWTSHRYKFKWSSQLFSLFRSNIHLWLPPPMNGTLSWKPSAWNFVLRWQSKANISNWSSLWAPPCPWTSTKQGDVVSKDQARSKEKPIFYQECKTQESSINQSINQSIKYFMNNTYTQVIIWELMRGKNYVVCVF